MGAGQNACRACQSAERGDPAGHAHAGGETTSVQYRPGSRWQYAAGGCCRDPIRCRQNGQGDQGGRHSRRINAATLDQCFAGDVPAWIEETKMTPLRRGMIDAMLLRGFAARTQEAYCEAVRLTPAPARV